MRYIVDTHVFLWTIILPKRLSKNVKTILADPELIKLVSLVTFWEISLKFSLKKIDLNGIQPDKLPDMAKDSNFEILNLTQKTASTYHKLPKSTHKDPFDRMLAWQAISHDCPLITQDKDFTYYKEKGLKIIW